MRAGLVALAIFGLWALSGCGGGGAQSGGPIHLTLWETYQEEEHVVFQQIRDDWEKRQHDRGVDVKLEISRVPFDGLLPKLKSSCLTGTTPDICRVDYAHVVPMAYGNAIWPLDVVADIPGSTLDKMRTEFVPAAIDSCLLTIRRKGQVERHLYGLPDQTNCVTLFYNRAMFRAAGLDPAKPPQTWDEFIQDAQTLTDPVKGTYGCALDNSLWWTFPFFNTFGAEILKQDAAGNFTCTLDDPAAVDAFGLRVDLSRKKYDIKGTSMPVEAGAFLPGALNKDQGFLTSRYAMALSGPWNLDVFRRGNVDFGVALVPRGPAGSSSTVGGTNMVVFRSCQHAALAYDFLSYLTSEEVQKSWCSRLGQIPVRPAVFSQVDTSAKPELKVFFEQMLTAKARPPVPNYDKLEEIANAQMDLSLQGLKGPKEALGDAAAKINADVLSALKE